VISEGLFVKDLSRLGRNLRRVVACDDSPAALLRQPRSLIQVPAFTGTHDRVLPALLRSLCAVDDAYKAAAGNADVRELLTYLEPLSSPPSSPSSSPSSPSSAAAAAAAAKMSAADSGDTLASTTLET
jgi:phytoene dehydrogenase-like protein